MMRLSRSLKRLKIRPSRSGSAARTAALSQLILNRDRPLPFVESPGTLCYPAASRTLGRHGEGPAMRLTRDQIGQIAHVIVRGLIKDEMIVADQPEQSTDLLVQVFTDDLVAEDKLNEEVREILQGHAEEINRGMVNYQEIFRKVKAKLARDRKLVI